MWITAAIATVFATVTMAKASTTRSKSSNDDSGSPRRRKREGKPKKPGNVKIEPKKPNGCSLKICSFHESFTMEMIIYERNDGEDGFLNYIRLFTMDEKENDILDELGITRLAPRRVPNSDNQIMLGAKKGYWRKVIIRYVDGPSTSASRQEALNKLKNFFLDPKYSTYPPLNIDTVDITNTEHPESLDNYFTDKDIELIMKEDFVEDDLTSNFVTNFPEVSQVCWKYQHVSNWARSIGFPLTI